MNRTILIVICDFLLVSLVAFSTVDINKVTDQSGPRQVTLDIATNQVDSSKDLAAVMRLALEDERQNRDALLGELTKTRGTLTEREREAQALQQELQQREQRAQSLQQELQQRDQQAQTLQQELQRRQQLAQSLEQELQQREQRARTLEQELAARQEETRRLQQEQAALLEKETALRQQQASLQQQYIVAQTNLQALSQRLQSTANEAVTSKEQLAAMEAELRRRAEAAAELQQQIAQMALSNQVVLVEKQRLAGQLQVAEVEKRHATEQVVALREQVQVEREEKAKLVEGVKTLASSSTQIVQEIRDSRPLTPNTIFNEFVSNRVQVQFAAVRSGLLGADRTRQTRTEMALVTDGTNTYALCHVDDTPLTLSNPGTDWEELGGMLIRETAHLPARTLSFHLQDPRIVFMPVTAADVEKLGAKVYRISTDPFKFQDAVLVGAREGYYGECRFEIDLTTPNYVRLDRSVLPGLFGKFNPSRGDLVFSKQGELLGMMANSSYCLMLPKFDAIATFRLGESLRAERTGWTLAALYATVQQFPTRLQ